MTINKNELSFPPLTSLQSFVIGSLSGAIEVLFNHPLLIIKNRLQAREPFTLRPRVLYTGLWLNVFSKTPITAIQVGMNQVLIKKIDPDDIGLSKSKSVCIALAAGFLSSFVCCPTERIITVMSPKTKDEPKVPLRIAVPRLLQTGGIRYLFIGLIGTILRESPFSAFFLIVYPQAKDYFYSHHTPNILHASLAAGISCGISLAALTQPADTIKTLQQSSEAPQSFYRTACIQHKKYGIPGFFKGLTPRVARVTSAVVILSEAKTAIENVLN